MPLCLQMHAAYRCRHAGACCSAAWMVPAEPHVLQVVRSRGILAGGTAPFIEQPGEADPVVGRRQDGTCVFFDGPGGPGCAIHSAAGAAALPSACRHFPREILMDPRGVLISLSHFCPTAAGMLWTRGPGALTVVEAPASLCLDEPLEGMDARDALPPLVRPGLLGDFTGYDAWERAALGVLDRADIGPERALALIAEATEDVRGWAPGSETLAERVTRAFAPARTAHPDPQSDARRIDAAIRHYLGARLFGNWIAYQGRGLRSIVAWLELALSTVHRELTRRELHRAEPTADEFVAAVGAADLYLLHSTDSDALGLTLAGVEGATPA